MQISCAGPKCHSFAPATCPVLRNVKFKRPGTICNQLGAVPLMTPATPWNASLLFPPKTYTHARTQSERWTKRERNRARENPETRAHQQVAAFQPYACWLAPPFHRNWSPSFVKLKSLATVCKICCGADRERYDRVASLYDFACLSPHKKPHGECTALIWTHRCCHSDRTSSLSWWTPSRPVVEPTRSSPIG